MKPLVSLDFPHRYEVELLPELPSSANNIYYFPGATQDGGHDGVLVGVREDGNAPWVGVFGYGFARGKQVTGIFACPNESELCVIARGRGYIGNAASPASFEELLIMPITDIRVVPEKHLLIFADFTTVFAWGITGLVWKSERLSSDGLDILSHDGHYISGTAWDASLSEPVTFKLDLETGKRG